MTTTTRTSWETSAAFNECYAEHRDRISKLLTEWGVTRNSEWPDGARFIRMFTLDLDAHWFSQAVELGRRCVTQHVPGWKLTELFPQRSWPEHTLDVFFVNASHGNVRKNGSYPKEAVAYIVLPDEVRAVHLGCDHPNATTTKQGNCYREFQCPDCGYNWGEDSSG